MELPQAKQQLIIMKLRKTATLFCCSFLLLVGCQPEEEEGVDLDEIVFLEEEEDGWEGISFEERIILHEEPSQEQMIIESDIAQNEPLTTQ